jgi:chemotaxis protein methyltransferase CheR
MQRLGRRHITDYLQCLSREETVRGECERRMTVPVNRFFRDRRLWEVLEGRVVPQLLDKGAAWYKIWSAGCARGEEVYSFKILWENLRAAGRKVPALEILAADLQPEYLTMAQRGLYGKSSLKEIGPADRSRWFEPKSQGGRFAVHPVLRAGVVWKVHDPRDPPPEEGFHMVFLRNNVAPYYREDFQADILTRLIPALAPAGFLFTGARERLPAAVSGLVPLPECRYILEAVS